VLYEMLTGRSAFPGATITDTLAAILAREPDWTALPASTPWALRRLLRRCLEKDRKRRLADIADAGLDIEEASNVSEVPARPNGARWISWLTPAALIVTTTLLALVGWLWFRTTPVSQRPTQFTFAAPAGETLEIMPTVPSPDGTRIAFISRSASGERALWVRRLDSTVVQRIAGSEEAAGPPFWSPDGRFVGFFAQGKLKKVDPSGGPALNICAIQSNLGATWNTDNVIVLAPFNRTALQRVSAAGGTPEPITMLDANRRENSHRWPQFLPDGRHFLFTARSDVKENNLIYVGALDSKEIKR
jgi:hypothetical protein